MISKKVLLMTASLIFATTAFAQSTGSGGSTAGPGGLGTGSTGATTMGPGTTSSGVAVPSTPSATTSTPNTTASPGAINNMNSNGINGGATAGATTTAESIRQAQTALNRSPNSALIVDGIMGTQTREAIRRYQTENNLPSSGQLDAATMQSLGIMSDDRAPASTTEPMAR